LGPGRRREMRQQLRGPHRDRMIAEGQAQEARYHALREQRAELVQTLRFFDSLGKPLSTWERGVLAEAEEEQR